MKTSRTISTISFNSEQFLRDRLDDLKKNTIISFWAYIHHKPEDDEGGLKDHFHLFIEPSKMVQTDSLRDEFNEFDPDKPDKPKSVIGFRFSRFDGWYLYALHDKSYLASKGQSRKYHYQHDEIVSSDFDDLLFRARSIDLLSLSRYSEMKDAIDHGLSMYEYFARGTVPMQQTKSFVQAWGLLLEAKTVRSKNSVHVDADTGEVLDEEV